MWWIVVAILTDLAESGVAWWESYRDHEKT
jgi:hypothetical protein